MMIAITESHIGETNTEAGADIEAGRRGHTAPAAHMTGDRVRALTIDNEEIDMITEDTQLGDMSGDDQDRGLWSGGHHLRSRERDSSNTKENRWEIVEVVEADTTTIGKSTMLPGVQRIKKEAPNRNFRTMKATRMMYT